MAVVHIASSLAKYADGERLVALNGSTIEEVLWALGARYPELQETALDGDGGVRPFISLFLNSSHVSGRNGLGSAVRDDDEISIISAIAGG